ncbi:MAG TPA: S-methyl-5'-thioinosine phosphorylase [Rhodanobacteraceae bacterium]|nr:S-methyl-5'-thioinosine phosphorylase [Rhodanobacteraceae bacterium]
MIDVAIIGGTGVYQWPGLDKVSRHEVDTPWGRPSDAIAVGECDGQRLAFLTRHGAGHRIAPHQVNYRANLWALRELGARRVIAVNAVGGIRDDMAPAVMAIPDDIIDYTWGREATFNDGSAEVRHAEFAEPYTATLRAAVLAAAKQANVRVVDGGCYGATQGPRLETRAEIARMRRDGCDLVGMTGMPEAALARELELEFACIALVANWAAGCGDEAPITMDEVRANVERASAGLPQLVQALRAR